MALIIIITLMDLSSNTQSNRSDNLPIMYCWHSMSCYLLVVRHVPVLLILRNICYSGWCNIHTSIAGSVTRREERVCVAVMCEKTFGRLPFHVVSISVCQEFGKLVIITCMHCRKYYVSALVTVRCQNLATSLLLCVRVVERIMRQQM